MPSKPATGRFATRLELAEYVWVQWVCTSRNEHDIAVATQVSDGTVHKILTSGEGRDTAKYYPEKARSS